MKPPLPSRGGGFINPSRKIPIEGKDMLDLVEKIAALSAAVPEPTDTNGPAVSFVIAAVWL
jgi:hypothetical protein